MLGPFSKDKDSFELMENHFNMSKFFSELGDLVSQTSMDEEIISKICGLASTLPRLSGLALFIVSENSFSDDKPKCIFQINGEKIPAPVSKRTLSGTLHAVNRDELEKIIRYSYRSIPGLTKSEGWLAVDSIGALPENEAAALDATALALGIALSRNVVTKRTEAINQRIDVFQALTKLSSSNASTSRIFEVLAKDAGFRTGASAAVTFQLDTDGETLHLKGAFGLNPAKLPRSIAATDSSIARSITLGTVISIPDMANSRDESLKFLVEVGMQSAHIAPLSLREDNFGALIILYKSTTILSQDRMQLLLDLVQGGAIALAGSLARDALSNYTHRLEQLVEERTSDLAVQTARADEASHAKSQFVANMSHELRTPLTAIVGFSSVLKEELFGPLNPEQNDAIASIVRATEHLKDLINDVLDMARVESGKEEAKPAEVNLKDVISQIQKLMMQTAAGKNISISSPKFSSTDDPFIAWADSRHIRQILINILSNAVKYTPPGGQISISLEKIADKFKISIKDSGVGIPTADRSKVFQEFSRLEDSYAMQQIGTGLGLNLTKKLVELNGGTIDFESEVGAGTTFSFLVPVFTDRKNELLILEPKEDARRPKGPMRRLDGLSTLILEDDQATRELLGMLLRQVGAEPVLTESTVEAKRIITETHFDVALIDLALRGESGAEMISFLRKEFPDMPIIVVSGCVFDNDKQMAHEKGANLFIQKPFDPHELIQNIREETIEHTLTKL